jgi:hypothetical protein
MIAQFTLPSSSGFTYQGALHYDDENSDLTNANFAVSADGSGTGECFLGASVSYGATENSNPPTTTSQIVISLDPACQLLGVGAVDFLSYDGTPLGAGSFLSIGGSFEQQADTGYSPNMPSDDGDLEGFAEFDVSSLSTDEGYYDSDPGSSPVYDNGDGIVIAAFVLPGGSFTFSGVVSYNNGDGDLTHSNFDVYLCVDHNSIPEYYGIGECANLLGVVSCDEELGGLAGSSYCPVSCGACPAEPEPETPDAVTVSCGNPANNNCIDDYCSSAEELHEVRCCSDTQIDNYQQRNGCAVWAESQFLSVGEGGDGCVHDASLATAVNTCWVDGARLCTLEEIQGACTAGTGCGHDADSIWTSDECNLNLSLSHSLNLNLSLSLSLNLSQSHNHNLSQNHLIAWRVCL